MRDDRLGQLARRGTYTVHDWLAFGLSGRHGNTVAKCTILANTHIIPDLGARKLRELSADDIDKWLADLAQLVSTRTLREVRSVLKRAITRAQARDKVKRNVRPGDSRMPSELVGVAGFEPAASSSRSHVAVPTASIAARLTRERPSASVRWRPPLVAAIVTHLVTQHSWGPGWRAVRRGVHSGSGADSVIVVIRGGG